MFYKTKLTLTTLMTLSLLSTSCVVENLTFTGDVSGSINEVLDDGEIGVLKASASSDDGNVAENILDNSLETRWSSYGQGEYVDLYLPGYYSLKKIDLAFFKGDERVSSFKIELMTVVGSNSSSSLALEADSSGESSELESFTFAGNFIGNRVRVTGLGNNDNLWNTISEVKLFGDSVLDYEPVFYEAPVDDTPVDESPVSENFLRPAQETTGITAEQCPNFESLKTVYTGDIVTTSEGQVIEYMEINGRIRVDHDNVVIKCVKVVYEGYYGIENHRTGKGTLIENADISGMLSAGVIGSFFTLKNSYIHNSGADGIKPYNDVVIESNYFSDLGYISDSHADGIQMVTGGNVTIRGNFFDMISGANGFKNSQCMILSTNVGTLDNILVEKNFLRGGGYCIQILDKGTGFGNPTNVKILDNTFYEGHQFGELRLELGSGSVVERNINVDSEETLAEQKID